MRGDSAHSVMYGGAVATGVVGAVAIVALYEGFIAKKSNSAEHAMAGHRQHRDRFVVTPILSPNGGGATLQLTW
jgi:hypothetical protein